MATRNDSFKSLTHKLEGEGKSAHYAQAIAGKVAKEKVDIGKKDAQSDRSEAEASVRRKREMADFHRDRAQEIDVRTNTGNLVHRSPQQRATDTRQANKYEGHAKDIEGMELDAQEKGDPWSDQNTRHDAGADDDRAAALRVISRERQHAQSQHESADRVAKKALSAKGYKQSQLVWRASELRRSANKRSEGAKDIEAYELDAQRDDASTNRDDDLDPDRIKRDLDDDRHESADHAVEKSIERHAAKRSDEESDMAEHDDLRGRIQALHDELDELESQLHGGDEPEGDEPEGDEPEGDEPSEDRNGEDEREAGKELAEGHEDVEHGDKAVGEELEHEAGEAEAEDRDHGGDDDGDDDDVREHRGDQAPEDVAESVTEADAQSSRRSVGVKRSFNNRHDSNEERDMTQRSDEDIRRRIDVLDARLKRATRSASYKERDELSKIRRRCDSVAQALGVRPEAPLPGEFPDEYRRRCAALLQPFSQSTKGVAIGRLDDAAFNVVEDRIYADAQIAAREPIKSLAGRLIPVESHDAAGRTITKYYGDPKAWMRPYMAPGVHIRFADSATRRNTGAR